MTDDYLLFLQFQSLFTMPSEVALSSFCTSLVDTYLTIRDGTQDSSQQLLNQFCATNWTVVQSEMFFDLNIGSIMSQVRLTELLEKSG